MPNRSARVLVAYVHIYIRTYIHSYIHTHIHVNKLAYIHTSARAAAGPWVCGAALPQGHGEVVRRFDVALISSARSGIRERSVRTYIHTYIPPLIHTYSHTHKYACMHTYVRMCGRRAAGPRGCGDAVPQGHGGDVRLFDVALTPSARSGIRARSVHTGSL